MPNAKQNSYPVQLQSYLGDGYKVINFGVSGSTITQHSKSGYVFTAKYTASLAFEPDIVLLEFGTNDSKPYITNSGRDLKKDYLEVIHKYQQLRTKPRIILVSPIKCFLPKGKSIQDDVIQQNIVPIIQEIAYEEKLSIIDLYRILDHEDTHSLYMDHLHPSPEGAGIMSQYIGNIILEKTIANKQGEISDAERFNFYGFQGYNFKIKGIDSKLVMPKQAAQGYPWVLRARFWGHEPQTDIALLERGFAIAYCDVANLFGNSEAITRFDQLYHYMRQQGFAKKVVLEGMSRGGLPIYNWAIKNPKNVACIYADAPVLDTKSWPMGKYSKSNKSQATDDLLKAYNCSTEQEVETIAINPIDNCDILAKSDIKILHVIGDADKVVPTVENTIPFSKKMESLGNKIKIIHKPGIGHHPHSLFNLKPILHFILKSTGYEINACTHPI